jgi:hypothetical protein
MLAVTESVTEVEVVLTVQVLEDVDVVVVEVGPVDTE